MKVRDCYYSFNRNFYFAINKLIIGCIPLTTLTCVLFYKGFQEWIFSFLFFGCLMLWVCYLEFYRMIPILWRYYQIDRDTIISIFDEQRSLVIRRRGQKRIIKNEDIERIEIYNYYPSVRWDDFEHVLIILNDRSKWIITTLTIEMLLSRLSPVLKGKKRTYYKRRNIKKRDTDLSLSPLT